MVEPDDPTAAFYNYPDDFRITVVGGTWRLIRMGAAIAAAISGNAPWSLVSDVWGKRTQDIDATHVCFTVVLVVQIMMGTRSWRPSRSIHGYDMWIYAVSHFCSWLLVAACSAHVCVDQTSR